MSRSHPDALADMDLQFESDSADDIPIATRAPNTHTPLENSNHLQTSSQLQQYEISSPIQYQTVLWSSSGPIPGRHRTTSPQQENRRIPAVSQESQAKFEKLQQDLLNDPYAAEPSYFTRPNRYLGPASTWRSWTENDRTVAFSLERESAMELNRHLFNAYVLKRKGEKATVGSVDDDRGRARKQSRKGKGKEDGDEVAENLHQPNSSELSGSFIPPKIWTAWPLPPDEVPRDHLLPNMFADSHRKGPDLRPSAVLEDCLIATMTKFARETWDSRDSQTEQEDDSSSESDSEEEPKEENDISMLEEHVQANDDVSPSSSSSESPSSKSSFEIQGNIQMFSSQMFSARSSSPSNLPVSKPPRHPVFTADDDRARELLLSPTRHLIAKLDELLLAAHQSRRAHGYRRQRSSSRSQSQDQNSASQSPVGSNKPKLSISEGIMSSVQPQASKSPNKRPLKPNVNSTTSELPHQAASNTAASRIDTPQLQDWSTVIGLAAIIQSFTPETIDRAGQRCANLFGENILMRTFHEAGSRVESSEKVDSRQPWFEDNFIVYDEESNLSGDSEDSVDLERLVNASHNDDHELVICVRTSVACSRCSSKKLKCQPLTQTNRTRKESNQLESCKGCIQRDHICSGIQVLEKIKTESPETRSRHLELTCPYSYCERYSIPFKKRSNLNRHITLAHGRDGFTADRTQSQSSKRGESPSSKIHPYFCPVKDCARSENAAGKPYANGSRLYEHIRNKHPDVDVEKVKQLQIQQRGEHRGRWTDERRRRSSRSQSNTHRKRPEERATASPGNGFPE